jgi:hypothetical protein
VTELSRVADEQVDIDVELASLEADLRRLEAEYNMYFAGRLPRPPWETRRRVQATVRRLDRTHIGNTGHRFRFSSLQARFSKFIDLWDRALRAREEGRPGPFAAPRAPEVARPKPAEDRVVCVTTFREPQQEMEKVQELYDQLAEARRQTGQDAIPFQKFADLVQAQVATMKEKGTSEVAFRVTVKDGKVAFTARGVKQTS